LMRNLRCAIDVEEGNPGSKNLLNALRLPVRPDQGIEDGQHVPAVVHHAFENIFQLRVALCFAVPFGEDRARHLDVPPQLVCGVAAQKQAIEKSSLALRILKILQRIGGYELWQRGHKENAVYRKAFPRQVGLAIPCRVPGNPPFLFRNFLACTIRPSRLGTVCSVALNALRC
jgi:hypothetical protein